MRRGLIILQYLGTSLAFLALGGGLGAFMWFLIVWEPSAAAACTWILGCCIFGCAGGALAILVMGLFPGAEPICCREKKEGEEQKLFY